MTYCQECSLLVWIQFLAFLLLLVFCTTAHAANVTDETSLRSEVSGAGNGGTIAFDSGVTVTLANTSAIDVTATNLTITGHADGNSVITASGARANPVFLNENSDGNNLTLRGLTFTGIELSTAVKQDGVLVAIESI